MKKPLFFLQSIIFITLISCGSTKVQRTSPAPSSSSEATEFSEIWGYVMYNHEKFYTPDLPVTDIGYFVKAVDTFSNLTEVPPKEKFFADTNARVHLTSSVDSKAQTHLLLSPEYSLRNKIIDQLVTAAETYDGIQIDWELVPPEDADNFAEFLTILREKLGNKMLTIAIPARTKTLTKDAYKYEKLAPLVDRVIIMAYDQHWSTSKPGTIAGTDWCQNITDYASSQIPPEKLVMGMSFYGRAWRDDTEGGRAYIYSSTNELMKKHKIKKVQRDEYSVPHFQFKKKLIITEYFDDAASLKIRHEMYKAKNVDKLSYWRIGQEDPDYWQYIKIKQAEISVEQKLTDSTN